MWILCSFAVLGQNFFWMHWLCWEEPFPYQPITYGCSRCYCCCCCCCYNCLSFASNVLSLSLSYLNDPPKRTPMWWVYLLQMSWYLHCTYAHLFFDKYKKDFWAMLTHHVVTLALVYFAFVSGCVYYCTCSRTRLRVLIVSGAAGTFASDCWYSGRSISATSSCISRGRTVTLPTCGLCRRRTRSSSSPWYR